MKICFVKPSLEVFALKPFATAMAWLEYQWDWHHWKCPVYKQHWSSMMTVVNTDRLGVLTLLPHFFCCPCRSPFCCITAFVLSKQAGVERRIRFDEISRSFLRQMQASSSEDVLYSDTFTTSMSCALLLKPSVSPSLTTPPYTSH